MIWGLLLSAAVAQTPDVQEQASESAWSSWQEAMNCLRDPARCNEAAGHFRDAAHWFEAYLQNGESPYDYLWIGYSYQAAGELPQAIAAYHRGLAVDPGYTTFIVPKLHIALGHARAEVQYPPTPDVAALMQPERDYWPGWLSLRSLGVYAFGLYFAACLAATRWRMTRRRFWILAAAGMLALAIVPAVGSAVLWQRDRRDVVAPVVIVARDCLLRIGNGVNYPPRIEVPLPRGAEVRRVHERNGWLQVELASGVTGWLPAEAVVGNHH